MGVVLKAHDTVLDRRVAIKISQFTEPVEQLLAEARIVSRLSHPNLCRVHDAGIDDRGRAFIVMEWVEGTTLRPCVGKDALSRNLSTFHQLLAGVAELHRNGITHTDLKPANVLIDHSGRPVVVDFGLADRQEVTSATPRGGTPGYSAPEQYDLSQSLTPATDVFALGVILYELCAGSPPPFVRGGVVRFDPAGLDAKSLEIPPPLLRICLKAMEPDPADRYPTIADLRADLQRYQRGESVLASPSPLRNSFIERLTAIRGHAIEWQRLGLITPNERRSLESTVLKVQRGESHWLFDIRRLLPTTVSVLFGAWLVVLALTIGISSIGPDLSTRASMHAGLLTFLATAFGTVLASTLSSRRFTVLWATSSLLCWPVAAWLILRHTGWFAATDPHGQLMALEYYFYGYDDIEFSDHVAGLSNLQILLVALSTAVLALIARILTRTGGITGVVCAALTVSWSVLWLINGGLMDSATVADARADLAFWTALGFVVIGGTASFIDRAEHRTSIDRGEMAVARDAPGAVWFASIGLVIALLTVAWSAPHKLLLTTPPEEFTAIDQAHALLVIAGILTASMLALAYRQTPLGARVGTLLRWLIPPCVFGALAIYESNDFRSLWKLWLVCQFVAAFGFLILSVRLQWRPFLFTAMSCIAIAYARLYIRIDEHMEAAAGMKLVIFVTTAVTGFAAMILATAADPIDRLSRRGLRSHR